jgi:hypothetical protein
VGKGSHLAASYALLSDWKLNNERAVLLKVHNDVSPSYALTATLDDCSEPTNARVLGFYSRFLYRLR